MCSGGDYSTMMTHESWLFKSLANELFFQNLDDANNKDNTNPQHQRGISRWLDGCVTNPLQSVASYKTTLIQMDIYIYMMFYNNMSHVSYLWVPPEYVRGNIMVVIFNQCLHNQLLGHLISWHKNVGGASRFEGSETNKKIHCDTLIKHFNNMLIATFIRDSGSSCLEAREWRSFSNLHWVPTIGPRAGIKF